MPRAKTFPRAPSNAHLKEIMELFSDKPQVVAECMGVSPQAFTSWLSGNRPAPKWTLLACEALKRRAGNKEPIRLEQPTLLLVKTNPAQAEIVKTFLKAVNAHVVNLEDLL